MCRLLAVLDLSDRSHRNMGLGETSETSEVQQVRGMALWQLRLSVRAGNRNVPLWGTHMMITGGCHCNATVYLMGSPRP